MTDPHDDLARHRARISLTNAPALAADLLQLAVPSDGRTDRGEELPEARIPLLSRPFDDADRLYGGLIEWVSFWAEHLGRQVPSIIAARRRRRVLDAQGKPTLPEVPWDDPSLVVGFPSGGELGLTPARVRTLTSILTTWLLAIFDHPGLYVDVVSGELTDTGRLFFDDVSAMTWTIRCRYGLTAGGRMRESSPRPCTVCGQRMVRITYFEPVSMPRRDAPPRLVAGPVGYSMDTAEELGLLPLWHLSREDRIREAHRASFGMTIRCDHCWTTYTTKPTSVPAPAATVRAWAVEQGMDVPVRGPIPKLIRLAFAELTTGVLEERNPQREWFAAWLS